MWNGPLAILSVVTMLYEVVVLLLVGLQSNGVELTVAQLMGLTLAFELLVALTLGFNWKISNTLHELKTHSTHACVQYKRKFERRHMLLMFTQIVSAMAAIDIWYIGQLIPDFNVTADDFRDSGNNAYVNRALDSFYMLFAILAIPVILHVVWELSWLLGEDTCNEFKGEDDTDSDEQEMLQQQQQQQQPSDGSRSESESPSPPAPPAYEIQQRSKIFQQQQPENQYQHN